MLPFTVCLSYLPSADNKACSHTVLHNEGRRILASAFSGDTVLQEASGRPYFAERRVDFSVSHSHAMVAVSWLADGRFRTGCDVQYVSPRRNHEAIAARFFAPSEQRYLARAETASDQRLRFCALWVLKESFLKLAGASIGDIDRTPCFALDDRLPSQSIVNGVAYTLYTCGAPAAPRYMLCVAREVADDTPAVVAPRLVWFSEARVAWAVGVGTRYAVPQRGGR